MYDEAEVEKMGYVPVGELLEKMTLENIFKIGRYVYIPKSFFKKNQLPKGHAKMTGYVPRP